MKYLNAWGKAFVSTFIALGTVYLAGSLMLVDSGWAYYFLYVSLFASMAGPLKVLIESGKPNA